MLLGSELAAQEGKPSSKRGSSVLEQVGLEVGKREPHLPAPGSCSIRPHHPLPMALRTQNGQLFARSDLDL